MPLADGFVFGFNHAVIISLSFISFIVSLPDWTVNIMKAEWSALLFSK